MSHTREIDNEEPLFQFDLYEGPADAASQSTHHNHIQGDMVDNISPFVLSSHDLMGHSLGGAISRDTEEQEVFVVPGVGKGKGVSKPMPIPPQVDAMHDKFGMVGSSSSGYSSQPGTSHSYSSPLTSSSFDLQSIQTPLDDIYQRFMIPGHDGAMQIPGSFDESHIASGSLPGKGKAKESAPMLPPLQFSPTEFGYSKADWPSPGLITPTPGPSSYGSGYGSVIESNINLTAATENDQLPSSPPILRRMPSRRHSFSNLSIHSTRSIAALSMTRIKGKFGASKGPGKLARKLLFRSRPGSSASSPLPTPGTTTPGGNIFDGDFSQGSCLMPWRNDFKSQARGALPPVSYLNLEAKLDQEALLVYRGSEKSVGLKGKGRSYSSPLPLSALDIVPPTSTDIFTPILIIPRNYFDEVLPRELRLRVLSSLIALHEAEHERLVGRGDWTVMRASSSKGRWVGKEKGVRELVKFSRVSDTATHRMSESVILFVGIEVVAGPRLRWSDVEQSEPTCLPQNITLTLSPSLWDRRHIYQDHRRFWPYQSTSLHAHRRHQRPLSRAST